MLIQRDTERMFCSDPADERGVNTAQTEERKAKHFEQVFLVCFGIR